MYVQQVKLTLVLFMIFSCSKLFLSFKNRLMLCLKLMYVNLLSYLMTVFLYEVFCVPDVRCSSFSPRDYCNRDVAKIKVIQLKVLLMA